MIQPPLWQPMSFLTPAQAEKKKVRRDANFIGFILIALLAGQYVVALVLRLLRQMKLLDIAAMNNTEYVLLNMVLYVVYLAVPALLVVLISRRRQNPFPTRKVAARHYVVALFGGMAMAVAANYITGWIMSILMSLGVPYPDLPSSQTGTPMSLVLNLVSTAVLPAILEEMVMRGYVMGALRRHGDKFAVVLSAALFGLIHGNVLQVPFAFMLGLALGWLVIQTGSIWPAVLLHFSNNAMSVLLEYMDIATGQNVTPTLITFLVLCASGMVVLTAAFLSNKPHNEDILRPIRNRVSALTVGQRVFTALTAPAMIVGVSVWIAVLLQLI